jgi:hypothetical protein
MVIDDMSLRKRIQLVEKDKYFLNEASVRYHYMGRAVHHRACPFGWAVEFDGSLYRPDGDLCGIIIFASVHYTRLRGEFGYDGLPTKWQVLILSRLWLHDNLPHNSETCVIGKALRQVQRRWLEVHPPRFLDEPYHIRKVISYADTRYHKGTIYRAANFREHSRPLGRSRHGKGKRGENGTDGAELICFIYDLPEPRWSWEPVQPMLF